MRVEFRARRWGRLRVLIAGAGLAAVSVLSLVDRASWAFPVFFAWWFLALSAGFTALAVYGSLSPAVVAVTGTGVELRGRRRPARFIPWSGIREVRIEFHSSGRREYKAPVLVLADGGVVPLGVIVTPAYPSPLLVCILTGALPRDRHFDEKVAELRRHVDEREVGTGV
jgi:hypothetical protein